MRILASLAFLAVSIAGVARADVPPPGLAECSGREAGDACSVNGQDGACEDSECGRLDYSQGVPPRSVTYPCVLCRPGAAPAHGAGGCNVAQGAGASGSIALLALAIAALRRRR